MLERYFKQKFAESFLYKDIGSWWELKGNAYEIDIVALCLEKDKAVAVEVKRQKRIINRICWRRKWSVLSTKYFHIT